MKMPFSAASHTLSFPKVSSSFCLSEPLKTTTVVLGLSQSAATLSYTRGIHPRQGLQAASPLILSGFRCTMKDVITR